MSYGANWNQSLHCTTEIEMADKLTPAQLAEGERCPHDLAERETACFDGYCPLCMAAHIREQDARLANADQAIREYAKIRDQLEAWLARAEALLRRADAAMAIRMEDAPIRKGIAAYLAERKEKS